MITIDRNTHTNLARPVERLVAFYNHRGTCEQYIKEGKGAVKWARLSCRPFAANAVRLQLHALAYNLGNFMRTLAMPKTAEPWSLTSLREKLIKIGAKVVSHGRYVLPDGRGRGAAADVPGNPVADRPAASAAGTGMTGRSGQIRQTTTAEVCLDARKSGGFRHHPAGDPMVGARTEAVAIKFPCGGTSRDGSSVQRSGIRGMSVEKKFWDVIGLYLDPPEKALVLCCDEKSQCQALERTQPGFRNGWPSSS